jgi:hypothetical protein
VLWSFLFTLWDAGELVPRKLALNAESKKSAIFMRIARNA